MEQQRFTKFPDRIPTPDQETVPGLYARTYKQILPDRDEVYISTPLTSGGARVLSYGELTVPDIVRNCILINSFYAGTVIREAANLFVEQRVTLPHNLGSRPGWKETDFIKYWMYYLSGIEPAATPEFEGMVASGVAADVTIFNNHELPREARVQEYERLLRSFVAFIQQSHASIRPVAGIALMPDHNRSLGCSLERQLGAALGVPLRRILFDINHPGFENSVRHIAPWLLLESEQPGTIKGTGESLLHFEPLG